jgi:hypothetical protein
MTVWERRDLPVLQALATSDQHLRHGFLGLSVRHETPRSARSSCRQFRA